jgi:hypothetical protein
MSRIKTVGFARGCRRMSRRCRAEGQAFEEDQVTRERSEREGMGLYSAKGRFGRRGANGSLPMVQGRGVGPTLLRNI